MNSRYPRLIPLILLVIALSTGCAKRTYVQAEVDTSTYRRLAVFPFYVGGTQYITSRQVTDEVIVALLEDVQQLELVDRSHIQDLTWEGTVGEHSPEEIAATLKTGRLLGVDAIMVGSLSLSLENVQPAPGQTWRVANGTAVVRLFDAEDGRIVWAKRIEKQESVLIDFHGDALIWDTNHEITGKVVLEIANAIAACFYPHEEKIR